MASRFRDQIKLEDNEIWFKNELVDGKRFGYDIIKYTTVKFGLPQECIFVWEGSTNDYGRDDFCLVMSREIIRYHITNRCQYLEYFETHYTLNKLSSCELVCKLLHTALYEAITSAKYDILTKVEISLSVLGELVLYLYARDLNLYLKQLINFWFDNHLKGNKVKFEEAGGLKKLYSRNRKPKFDHYDDFHDLFISHYCVPYKDTANNSGIAAVYNRSYGSRTEKDSDFFPPIGFKDIDDLMYGGEMVMLQSEPEGYKSAFGIEEEKPEPDETGVKLPENILLGIPEHQEYAVGGPSSAVVPPSQDLPEVNPEELQYGRLSAEEKMELRRAKFCPGLDQGLGIPERHELYTFGCPSGVVVPPSQDFSQVNPEEFLYGRRLTAEERWELRSEGLRLCLDQGPENPELYASGGPSSAVVPPSQDLPEAPPRHGRRPSAREGTEMRAGVRPSLEESLGEMSLDSS